MKIGRFFGITVKIHWTMLMFMAVGFWAGIWESVLLMLGAVLLHEFSHAAAARVLKVQIREVQLFPFGGQAKMEDFTAMYPVREIGIALAGPAASFLLAGLFSFAHFSVQPWSGIFVRVNALLFLFNLLPVLPLDGGRILRAILSKGAGYRRATRITAGLGQFLGGVFLVLGIVAFWQQQGLHLFLIGGVLLFTARREQKFFSYSFLRFLMRHKQQLHEQMLLPVKNLVCMRQTEVRQVLEDLSGQYYLMVTVVDEQHRIIRQHSESQLTEAFLERGPHIQVQEIPE